MSALHSVKKKIRPVSPPLPPAGIPVCHQCKMWQHVCFDAKGLPYCAICDGYVYRPNTIDDRNEG